MKGLFTFYLWKAKRLLCKTRAFYCPRRDLNPHTSRYQILSLACLPFHHTGFWLGGVTIMKNHLICQFF